MVVAAKAAAAPAPRQALGGLRRGGGAGVAGHGGRSPGPAMGRPELGALRPLALWLLLLLLLQLQHLSAADPLPGGQGAYGSSRPALSRQQSAAGGRGRCAARPGKRGSGGSSSLDLPWISSRRSGYGSSAPVPSILLGDGPWGPPRP